MTSEEKIAVIKAQDQGVSVQHRPKGGSEEQWAFRSDGAPYQFNFGDWDYRIAPAPRQVKDLQGLADRHHVHIDDIRAIASLAKAQRRSGGVLKLAEWKNDLGNSMPVTISQKGDVQYGCQAILWEEVDKFAKRHEWWRD